MRTLIVACMLTFPVLAQPTPSPANPPAEASTLPVITITKDGAVWLNEQRTDTLQIAETIRQRFGAVNAIYLRADKETRWAPIAQAVATLNSAKPPMTVNLVTKLEPSDPKAPPSAPK